MTLRDAFPVLQGTAYLNAGSNGPVPQASADAMAAEVEAGLREGRGTVAWSERASALRTAQREAYARALGARPADVAVTSGTSEGMVRVLAGLDWAPGDEVVTADDEHPGLLGPLATLRERRGVAVRAVPLRDVADAVGPRTRLVACSHVSWTTGEVAPEDLALVPAPVLLDGAQGLGAVPVDLEALGCDFYAAAGQKWLCGPAATGCLWVRPGAGLAPLGATHANLVTPADGLDARAWPDARAHDVAAPDPVLAAGAAAAAEVLEAHPGRLERAAALAARLAERLAEAGRTVAPRGPTTLVAWEDGTPADTVLRLLDHGVVVRNLPGTPYLRAAVGAWNDEEDLERLLAAL